MKITVAFIDQSGGPSSGAQQSLVLLLDALPTWIQPVVIVFSDGDFAARLRNRGHRVIVHPVHPNFAKASRFRAPSWYNPIAIREVFRLAKLLRELNPDLVHTNTVKAHIIGIPAAMICRIPSVMHLRDSLGGLSRHLLAVVGRLFANQVVAVSRRVDRWYSVPNTRVIYNPFERLGPPTIASRDVLRSRLDLPGHASVIGIVGPIHRNKGQERFIRIVANLQNKVDVFGLIVGDSRFSDEHEIPRLKSLAETLGILHRIKFVSWLNNVSDAYAALDLLCNCSTNEPFGRTVVEASSFGVACCIFDDCGASEVLVDRVSASISPAHDEIVFSARVLELLTDPDLLCAVSSEAKKAVESLTVEKHVSQIEEVYTRILRICRHETE